MIINLTESQKIVLSNTINLEFDCYTKPAFYPYDDIVCNLQLNSRHGIKLKWKYAKILTVLDITEGLNVREHSIEAFESNGGTGRNGCIPLDKGKADEVSCLNLHFHFQRNNGQFDWMFYLPSFTLPFCAYITLYLANDAQTLRILVCVLAMDILIAIYFIFDLFLISNPTTSTNELIPIEYWFFGSVLFAFFILLQYIISIGKQAFDIWYVEYYHQLQHYTDKVKINDTKWNNAKRSNVWNFVRWFTLQLSNVFVKSTEDILSDIFSRLFYLALLIGAVSYYMFFFKREILNNLKIDNDVCEGLHRKFDQITFNKNKHNEL